MWVAFPLQLFYYLFRPFIWLLNGFANRFLKLFGIGTAYGSEVHSAEELKYLIQKGTESGEIELENYGIIKNAFDFSKKTVRQIMIPRTQVVALNVDTFDESQIANLVNEGYSRIPCYEGTIDNVVGLVRFALRTGLVSL